MQKAHRTLITENVHKVGIDSFIRLSQISILMNLFSLFSQIKASHVSGNAVPYRKDFNRKISISVAVPHTFTNIFKIFQ